MATIKTKAQEVQDHKQQDQDDEADNEGPHPAWRAGGRSTVVPLIILRHIFFSKGELRGSMHILRCFAEEVNNQNPGFV